MHSFYFLPRPAHPHESTSLPTHQPWSQHLINSSLLRWGLGHQDLSMGGGQRWGQSYSLLVSLSEVQVSQESFLSLHSMMFLSVFPRCRDMLRNSKRVGPTFFPVDKSAADPVLSKVWNNIPTCMYKYLYNHSLTPLYMFDPLYMFVAILYPWWFYCRVKPVLIVECDYTLSRSNSKHL